MRITVSANQTRVRRWRAGSMVTLESTTPSLSSDRGSAMPVHEVPL
jgi:hypothetical protein